MVSFWKTGLGPFADTTENAVRIPYNDIPHFASSSAVGHANELVIGAGRQNRGGDEGRFHYYEGVSLDQVTFPVRLMKALGVEKLIITNACGAVNATGFASGDLMLITDHLNLTANNPLIGPNNPDLGVRFPDVSEVYSKNLRGIAKAVAAEQGVTTRRRCLRRGPVRFMKHRRKSG